MIEEPYNIVASSSAHKVTAVHEFDLIKTRGVSIVVPENPEQPIGDKNTFICGLNRLIQLMKTCRDTTNIKKLYAIESGIDFRKGEWVDICHIISFDLATFKIHSTFERRKQAELMNISEDPRDIIVYPFQEMVHQLIDEYKWTPDKLGVPKTVGEQLSKMYDVEKSNWMEKLMGISRKSHIFNCMYNLQEDTEDHWIRELLVRSFKKTEESQDIYPIYNHPLLMKILLHLINKFIKMLPKQPTHVAGLELYGGLLAQGLSLEYGLTIIPINNKKNKKKLSLPTYSSENLEIFKQDYKDAIVLVVDDIITTGESLHESLELFERHNIETIGGLVVTEEAKLRHDAEIKMGKYPYYVLLWGKI